MAKKGKKKTEEVTVDNKEAEQKVEEVKPEPKKVEIVKVEPIKKVEVISRKKDLEAEQLDKLQQCFDKLGKQDLVTYDGSKLTFNAKENVNLLNKLQKVLRYISTQIK